MEFNFGDKMKSLRKKRDLTQEQLAEILGVSFQAVSKWETNAAYPDISLITVIACFYGVTTDELLGVDVTKTVEKVRKYCDKADIMFESHEYPAALAFLRKAVTDYPGYEELQYRLAWALTGNYKENPDYLDEAINLYLKILDVTQNTRLRSKITRDLVYRYCTKKDNARAMKYIEELPTFDVCREYTLGLSNLLEGKNLADYLKSNICIFGNAILECLEYMKDYKIISKEQMAPEIAETAQKKIELMKMILNGMD